MHERECKGYISFNRGVNELNRGVNELNRGVNHSVARQGCNLLRAAVTSAVTSQGCCCGNLQIHPLDLGHRLLQFQAPASFCCSSSVFIYIVYSIHIISSLWTMAAVYTKEERVSMDTKHINFYHYGCLSCSIYQTPSLLDRTRTSHSLLSFYHLWNKL